MSFTITQKIFLTLAIVWGFSILTGLSASAALTTIKTLLDRITGVEEPRNAATYEMEINTIGMALGVMKYLETGEPQHRARVEKDLADFARFKARYDRLASTPPARALGERIDALHQEFQRLGYTLMHTRDEQETRSVALARHFTGLATILHHYLWPLIDQGASDSVTKTGLLARLEADTAEVGTWLGHYLRTGDETYRRQLFDEADAVRATAQRFQALTLSYAEQYWSAALVQHFEQALALVQDLLTQRHVLDNHFEQFMQLRTALDDVLDEGIQVLTQRALTAAQAEAHQVVRRTQRQSLFFLLLSVLGSGATVMLCRHKLLKPLREVTTGAEKLAAGALEHRMAVTTRDELGTLAMTFNQMAARLQQDKENLEGQVRQRTAELVQANAQLRQELAERQQAEVALRESEHQYRDLYEEAPHAYFSIGVDGQILQANRCAVQLLGYPLEALRGRPIVHVYADTPAGKAEAQEVLRRFQAGAEIQDEELQMCRADGTPVWISLSMRPVRDAHGTLRAIRSMVVDITARRQAEHALREEVRIRQRLAQAERLASLGTLAAGLAHELNQPLTAMRVSTDSILYGMQRGWLLSEERLAESLQRISEQCDRAAALLHDVRLFARDNGPHQTGSGAWSAGLERIWRMLGTQLSAHGITLQSQLTAQLPRVTLSQAHLEQILINLLTNARQALDSVDQPTKVIALTASQEGNMVTLRVEDNGPGIAPEIRSQLFDPFFTTKAPGEGSGLGLSIVHGLVTEAGGDISVAEGVAGGTAFLVQLPVAPD